MKSRAQSLGEYSICVAFILLALLGLQVYAKRGLQGRYKDLVDNSIATISEIDPAQYKLVSKSESGTIPYQYEVLYREDTITDDSDIEISEAMLSKGEIQRQIVKDILNREGSLKESIDEYE